MLLRYWRWIGSRLAWESGWAWEEVEEPLYTYTEDGKIYIGDVMTESFLLCDMHRYTNKFEKQLRTHTTYNACNIIDGHFNLLAMMHTFMM